MSRRYIYKSKFNDLNQVKPEVVSVVSSRDNLQTVNDEQKYFKRNYIDTIRKIIPKFYLDDDQTISGKQIPYTSQLINSHILANKNQNTIFPVSALASDVYLSAINTPSGFAPYFYKRKSPAQINPDDFERNILNPLDKNLRDFGTSAAFANYISGTLLPSIPAVFAGHHDTDNLATLTASAYSEDSSGTYKYLVNSLGWVYFLNRTGPAAAYGLTPFDPSNALTDLFVNTIWKGRSIVLQDALEIYQEYLWKNQPIWNLDDNIIPTNYVSSLDISSGTYTSGTQHVDRLKTLVSIVYSPHFLDSVDNKIEDSFTNYFNTSTASLDGDLITDEEEAGPLKRFLDAISFAIADRVTEQAELNTLYDIGECPEQFLELLGELIGWKLIGADVDKWRVQLRNAVEIYKMKGTRRSIQYLMDILFAAGVFDFSESKLLELWESYVPDLIYYALATSSQAFDSFDSYTKDISLQFGIPYYDTKSMDTNIRYAVDKILFDLVREFPNLFFMGNKPFPTPQLMYSPPDALFEEPYFGKYNIDVDDLDEFGFPKFYTGDVKDENSNLLYLDYDPNFLFNYRNRVYLIPPFEKRQYYTPTRVNEGLLERLEFYLICYGVDKAFANDVVSFIRKNTTESDPEENILNTFFILTKDKKYPPNYEQVLKNYTKQKTPDPVSLLSMWNGKSSHFLINFDSSTFDFNSKQLLGNAQYGIKRLSTVIDEVVPAHAMPLININASEAVDGLDALADNDCREIRPNFKNLYEGSSQVITSFESCAIDMEAVALANGITPKRFKRNQVDNINDVLISGTTFVSSLPRNSLRRRNLKNLLPETKFFTRNGRNNPGSLMLSSSYYTSTLGYVPLGFMPSSLSYHPVSLLQNPNGYGIGKLLNRNNLIFEPSGVWEICENLTSPRSYFGYDVSNTFASRAKQDTNSSSCYTYGRRGQLQEIIYVMNKVYDMEKFLEASSMVSGYFNSDGTINSEWPSGNEKLTPSSFSNWYAENNGDLNVVQSIANSLINEDSSEESLNYFEHFKFGRKLIKLYDKYIRVYGGHATNNNYDKLGVPNMFSHTFGPLIYNHDFDVDGSSVQVSSNLVASTVLEELDISFYGNSGVLGPLATSGGDYYLGTVAASNAVDLPIGGVEFRNKHIVSSIELVDTSTASKFAEHPIFSIFRLSRDDQNKYSYNKYLINNQIIKYHRNTNTSVFPRIRIPLSNSDSTNKARNFLEPDHEYEITIKAHVMNVDGQKYGGLPIGFWIHTDPELDEVWSYFPAGIYDDCGVKYDYWEKVSVSDLSSDGGVGLAESKAQYQSFDEKIINTSLGSGETSNPVSPITIDTYDYRCWDPLFQETYIPGAAPLAIANIDDYTLETFKFKFSTKNNKLLDASRSLDYIANIGKVHRLDQNYTIEIFSPVVDDSKFVVFEEISIKDLTNEAAAAVETNYGDAQLDARDLKTIFRYFKDLSTGLASKNALITSSVMDVSGGSRINYRSNTGLYNTSYDPSTYQLSTLGVAYAAGEEVVEPPDDGRGDGGEIATAIEELIALLTGPGLIFTIDSSSTPGLSVGNVNLDNDSASDKHLINYEVSDTYWKKEAVTRSSAFNYDSTGGLTEVGGPTVHYFFKHYFEKDVFELDLLINTGNLDNKFSLPTDDTTNPLIPNLDTNSIRIAIPTNVYPVSKHPTQRIDLKTSGSVYNIFEIQFLSEARLWQTTLINLGIYIIPVSYITENTYDNLISEYIGVTRQTGAQATWFPFALNFDGNTNNDSNNSTWFGNYQLSAEDNYTNWDPGTELVINETNDEYFPLEDDTKVFIANGQATAGGGQGHQTPGEYGALDTSSLYNLCLGYAQYLLHRPQRGFFNFSGLPAEYQQVLDDIADRDLFNESGNNTTWNLTLNGTKDIFKEISENSKGNPYGFSAVDDNANGEQPLGNYGSIDVQHFGRLYSVFNYMAQRFDDEVAKAVIRWIASTARLDLPEHSIFVGTDDIGSWSNLGRDNAFAAYVNALDYYYNGTATAFTYLEDFVGACESFQTSSMTTRGGDGQALGGFICLRPEQSSSKEIEYARKYYLANTGGDPNDWASIPASSTTQLYQEILLFEALYAASAVGVDVSGQTFSACSDFILSSFQVSGYNPLYRTCASSYADKNDGLFQGNYGETAVNGAEYAYTMGYFQEWLPYMYNCSSIPDSHKQEFFNRYYYGYTFSADYLSNTVDNLLKFLNKSQTIKDPFTNNTRSQQNDYTSPSVTKEHKRANLRKLAEDSSFPY